MTAVPAEKFVWFHWQNLNDRKGGDAGSGLRHGRCWWHFRNRRQIGLEWSFLTARCHAGFSIGDEDFTVCMAIPLLISLYLSFSVNWMLIAKLAPRRVLSPNYPDTIVIDERTCDIRVHSGAVWISPWSKTMETCRADPWWVRGVNFSINPFEWRFMRHEERRADGSWVIVPSWKMGEGMPESQAETTAFPYRYTLKNGTVQDRTATVKVERRAWRPRCLRWTAMIEKVNTVIDVRFSDEVGERSGSWKGGTIGCSYGLLPNETAEQCLRRMERDRRF